MLQLFFYVISFSLRNSLDTQLSSHFRPLCKRTSENFSIQSTKSLKFWTTWKNMKKKVKLNAISFPWQQFFFVEFSMIKLFQKVFVSERHQEVEKKGQRWKRKFNWNFHLGHRKLSLLALIYVEKIIHLKQDSVFIFSKRKK